MKAKKVHSTSLEHTQAFAAYVVRELLAQGPAKKGATVIGLYGELGAGKTTFTKEIARLFGITRTVASPTFVLERIYTIAPKFKFERFIHIDAYRLENGSELAPLDFDTLMKDPQNLIFLEWPEKVADALPVPLVKISFVVHPDGSRTISYG